MPLILRTSVAVTVASLALCLIVGGGAAVTNTGRARSDPRPIVIHRVDTGAPELAGFGSSPGSGTSSVMAACVKGQHFPDPTFV